MSESNTDFDRLLEVVKSQTFYVDRKGYRFTHPKQVTKLIQQGWRPSQDPYDI